MTLPKILSLPNDSERGYILEVDMHLPEEYHENYPVAPEKKPIIGTQLSHYQWQVLREDIIGKTQHQVR